MGKLLPIILCLLCAGLVLTAETPQPLTLPILDGHRNRSEVDGTFCLDTTAKTGGASAICSLQGNKIALGSAADLLVAARFINNTNQTNLAGCISSDAGPAHCSAYSTSSEFPWVASDYSIQMQLNSSRMDAQKKVKAQADLDFFLCNNAECEVVADLQYVDPHGEEQQPSLTMAYARLKDTTVGLPVFHLVASTHGRIVPVSPANWPKGLPADVSNASLSLSRVLYPEDPGVSWLQVSPNMVPVGSWARAVGAFDKLRVGYYRAANLDNCCIRIIYPAHDWMHDHGWGSSSAGCDEDSTKSLYAFSSYFTQAFWWKSKHARVDVNNKVSNLSLLSLHKPPQNLPSAWSTLANEWHEWSNGSDWMSTHGMYTYCDDQSQSTTDAGTQCYFTDQSSGGIMSCDAAPEHCVVAVIGSAAVVLWNLTELRDIVPDTATAMENRTILTLRGTPDHGEGDYDNQGLGENPLAKPGWPVTREQNITVAIGLRFLLPMVHMASASPLPWCASGNFKRFSPKTSSTTYCHGASGKHCFSGIPCHKWGPGLGFVNASDTPLGPSTKPLLQSNMLLPTRANMSIQVGDLDNYPGFVGHERTQNASLAQGIDNLIKASIREVYQLCALQVSVTDSTTTWKGGLISLTLLLVSVLAVGTSRRDMDDWCMRLFGVQKLEDWPLPKVRSVWGKVLSWLVAALTIVTPPTLVLLAEDAARKDNNPVDKVVWLSVPAHGWGRYKVLVAVTIHMWPVYDDHGYRLVKASLAMACLAVLVIAVFSGIDFWKRCISPQGKLEQAQAGFITRLPAAERLAFGVDVHKPVCDDSAMHAHKDAV